MSSNPSKSPSGTVLSRPEATLWINSFNTDLGTFGSLFTFGVTTSCAVLKGSLKKQCCNYFLHHLPFLQCSADLKTRLLFFNSSMRQTNPPYSFSSVQLLMAFAKSFILLQTFFNFFKHLGDFLIFITFFIMPNKLKAS